MGLIRSGMTALTVNDDEQLTPLLWAVVKEMIKTAVENEQNLIIEGCYIPFDWKKDFGESYLTQIKYYCLIMTAEYIENNFSDILKYESVIEKRLTSDGADKDSLKEENERNLRLCKQYGLNFVLIDGVYDINIDL